MTLTFFSDAGHGWLKAPKALIRKLGVQVSSYSYQKGDNAYLEEDADALRFIEAAEAAGYKVVIDVKYSDRSTIRNYQSYR